MGERMQIAVIGSGARDERIEMLARKVGGLLAGRGAVVICGGLRGAMSGASEGAREAGGTVVGILPGTDKNDANPFVDIAIATGMGHARNTLVVGSADGVIALPGGPGTLSEVALALKMGKPVVGLCAWNNISGVIAAESAEEAVHILMEEL